jgi:hypothetical protein
MRPSAIFPSRIPRQHWIIAPAKPPIRDLELPTLLADKRILSFLLPPFGALFSMSPDTLLMGQIRKRKEKFRPNFIVLD